MRAGGFLFVKVAEDRHRLIGLLGLDQAVADRRRDLRRPSAGLATPFGGGDYYALIMRVGRPVWRGPRIRRVG